MLLLARHDGRPDARSAAAALAYARRARRRFLRGLAEFVAIPSVSAAPDRAADVRRCAEWLAARLRQAGLARVRLAPTRRHPLVFGEWRGARGAPTLLIYGHYDVQPVAPLAAWRTPPFTPTLRGAWLHGRGASDDKGQLFAHVCAIESWRRGAGGLPVNVQCLFEGEEEIGSPNLADALRRGDLELAPDAMAASDMAMAGPGRPAITYATRGHLSFDLEVTGPPRDLHSGVYGGIAPNPLQALCQIIARLHDEDGRIAVPGVYDRVRRLGAAERGRMRRYGPSDARLRQDAGLRHDFGAPGLALYERTTAWPALTINGLCGGYCGAGAKGVIPSRASAKLSFRLVADQDPTEIARQLRAYLAENTPPGVRLRVKTLAAAAPGATDLKSAVVAAAAKALKQAFGAEPALLRSGGTIPVATLMQRELDAPMALFGFGQRDDGMHAPNERFHVPTLFRAIEASIFFLNNLAAQEGRPDASRPSN